MRLRPRLPRPARRDRRPRGAAARPSRRLPRRRSASTPTEPMPAALIAMLDSAIVSAGNVRDRFSIDGWTALNDLAKTAAPHGRARHRPATTPPAPWACCCARSPASPASCTRTCTASPAGGSCRSAAALERAIAMAGALAWLADPEAPDGALDLAVEIGDSVMSHRRRYAVTTTRETVVDLLALDTMNPRSVLYHLERDPRPRRLPARRRGQRPDVARSSRARAAGPHRPRGRDPRDRRRRGAARADRSSSRRCPTCSPSTYLR